MPDLNDLKAAFAEMLEVEPASLHDGFSQKDAKLWDSLGMIRLIAEVEQRFDVQFDLMEIAEFRDFGSIRRALAAKGIPV
ncbi:MAG: acyl carrier protein [Proteobacteria bacterium]|nr:acyl carrier protein [Pseudomonadota bacterium]